MISKTDTNISRTFDILQLSALKYHDHIAISAKKAGEWKHLTYFQYENKAKQLAKALIAENVSKGDKIASLSNSRPEWNIIDMAINMCGGVHVPISPNYSTDDLHYILEHTDITMVFVFNKLFFTIIQGIASNIPAIKKIFLIDFSDTIPCLDKLMTKGNDIADNILSERMNSVKPDDLSTIYFTSGTGGRPKGAMVMHQNIVNVVLSMSEIYFLHPADKVISYLPLSHSFESAHNYMYQYSGVNIHYAENMASVIGNLTEVNPVMFLSVPLILEQINSEILKIKNDTSNKQEFENAYQFAITYQPENNNFDYKNQYNYYKINYYDNWRKLLGNNIQRIAAGGASLPEYLARLFFALEIIVLEVYGLTETYAIAVNSIQYGMKIGTVGVPERNVEVQITEDNEIVCRSPYIIKGYYKNEMLTRETIDQEGWFHTGDLGEWIDHKFLKITGRKKDVFKTASGNFVSPQLIEKQLTQSQFVKHVLVVGKDKYYLSAIIVPDFESLKLYCNELQIPVLSWKTVLQEQEILKLFQELIDAYNRKVWDTERILKFALIDQVWTVQSGELTPTMKLRRSLLIEKYAELINSFYN